MKHLLALAMAFMTLTAVAQEKPGKTGKERTEMRPDFTPEQIATMKSKELALKLDLDATQQAKVQELQLAMAKDRLTKREEMKSRKESKSERPTADELYEMKNERLDKALAHKQEMKNILSSEQYKKWEEGNQLKMRDHRRFDRKKMIKRKRMAHARHEN
ncbi:MAG: hypothetical protein HKN96_05695 [Flavobacteriaceae bacterium]|nr:hypothetical protein [Flavobacteriaceae bacterium]